MFTTLLTLLALVSTANAADLDYTACTGKTGAAMTLCKQQIQIADLQHTCSQVCTDAPAAPAATSGSSRTYLVLDAYGKRLDELEGLVRDGVVSEKELEVELTAIGASITLIQGTLADHEARIKALEDAEPEITAPPMLVEGPVGPQGPVGANGRDGRPAEFTTSVGFTTAAGDGWSHTGFELAFTAGGRPTDWLRLGVYGSGHVFAADSLGFAVGGATAIRPAGWVVEFPVEAGWREAGIHFVDGDAQHAIQGVEVRGGVGVMTDVGFTARITLGGWFPGGDDGSAFVGQLSGGWHF